MFLKVNKICSILLISVLISACSESSSKEDAVVKGLMDDKKITEKQAKCLIKETKPIVTKEDWDKYTEVWNMIEEQADPNEKDLETMISVGFAMMSIGNKCNVIF